eukprot:3371094-Prymnesium_polylepis.1
MACVCYGSTGRGTRTGRVCVVHSNQRRAMPIGAASTFRACQGALLCECRITQTLGQRPRHRLVAKSSMVRPKATPAT